MLNTIRALRVCICAILAILTLTTAAKAQEPPDTTTKYGIIVGIKLYDGAHAPTIGGTMTHTNGFTSIITIDIKQAINAIEYNAALRLTKPGKWSLRALFGPEIEAPEGNLTAADRITYLTLASGLALTYRPANDGSFSIAAWYHAPNTKTSMLKLAFVTHFTL